MHFAEIIMKTCQNALKPYCFSTLTMLAAGTEGSVVLRIPSLMTVFLSVF